MVTFAHIAVVLNADPAVLERTAKVEEARVEEAPDDTEALYRLGLAYLGLGQPQKALKPLRELVKKDSDNVDGKVLLARALRLTGDGQEAKSLLDTALTAMPDDVALQAERGL